MSKILHFTNAPIDIATYEKQDQLRKSPVASPVNPATEQIQPPPRKNKLAKRWIPAIIFLILLLLTATATATATSASKPTASDITVLSSDQEITVRVTGDTANLRAGPGTNFAKVRVLTFGERLMLLGRLKDNTWLQVKTADGQEGWIKSTLVDLAVINIDNFPIKTPPPTPEATFHVSSGTANLRSGPDVNFEKVKVLSYGEQLLLLGRLSDNSWLYVKTVDGQEGWIKTTLVDLTGMNVDNYPVKTPPPKIIPTPKAWVRTEDRWIDIDLSDQMLYAFDGADLVASFLVSTGTDLFPTERGLYHIYVKYRYSDMHGTDYFLPNVPYTMYYQGDFSIHGTYWHHNFGTPMSHGCVNMDTNDAEWLYNWSSIGTIVNIHR